MKNLSTKIASLIAGALTLHAPSTWAATCSVPSLAYPTIQSAVDDSACTTINVAPGAYPENVTIARSLTLNGAQAGQPIAGRTSGGPTESTMIGANPAGAQPVFAINAPSVTIDGFTIKNAVTTGAAIGVQINPGSNDAVLTNSFLDGIVTTDGTAAGTAQAIYIQNDSFNLNIGANDIRNVSSNGSATGVLVGDNNALAGPDITFIHDNAFTAITSAAADASAAICRKVSFALTSFYFRENRVSNLNGATLVRGVSVECDTVNALVIINDFTALSSGTGDVAAVSFINDPRAYSSDASGNNFDLPETAFGVKVEGADATIQPPPMNAGCNWWGSPDGPGPVGPGHGCQVSPNVQYGPWRVTTSHDAQCIGSNTPTTEAQCKNGGWITHVRPNGTPFKNQGDCVSFVNTGN